MTSPTVRITVDLPSAEAHTLASIAGFHGTTLTEALRRAIAITSHIQGHLAQGNKFLLEKDGEFVELEFAR